MTIAADAQIAVLISANAEWECAISHYRNPTCAATPAGVCFVRELANRKVLFFHSGWGKVSSAAAAQYVIDHWAPQLLINLGTCGGFSGCVQVGEVILPNETLIYDIYERMGDAAEAIRSYSTRLDLRFLCQPFPREVRISRLISADQDIDPDLAFKLKEEYGAVAADWESGAIAWVAQRNHVNCLILRVVSDLVDSMGGELYEQGSFAERTREVFLPLLTGLPNWIRCAQWGRESETPLR
mgnify:CR=1 FL=1